jgi:hypothetical protein
MTTAGTSLTHGTRFAHVHAEDTAACPFSIAEDYAHDYLRRAEQGGAEAVMRVPVGLGSIGRTVRLDFAPRADTDERGRAHDELLVTWSAGTPLLPSFRGTIRFRIAGDRTRVILDGSYVPPGGTLGRLADRAIGRHIADRTARDLVRRIAADLGERERRWRAEHPPL